MNLLQFVRMSPARLARTAIVVALVVFGFSACATTEESTGAGSGETHWLMPSPALRQRIEEQAKRLPWTHGTERIELIRWFAGIGEPAYPTLLAMVLDPRPDVAGSALAALGATHDSRLVEELHKLPWPESLIGTDLDLERARTLLRLGDWQEIPVLIRGLQSDELMTRALCHQALGEATHEHFDYDPKGEPEVRAAAVKRWETWWLAHSQDPLLQEKH
jgi:hypothetical protein